MHVDCSLVRSNIEYCSVVWSPYSRKNIDKLEGVQRRTTKFILKTKDSYETRLEKLNLLWFPKGRKSSNFVTILMKRTRLKFEKRHVSATPLPSSVYRWNYNI